MKRALLALALLSFAAAEPLKIKAKKITYGGSVAVAVGGVVATYKDLVLTAERLTADRRNSTVVAEGGVLLKSLDGEIFVRADRAIYYAAEEKIEVQNAEGRIKDAFFKSERAFIKGRVYEFRNFCGSKCSDFQAEVCSKKFRYDADAGRGELKSARLRVEGKTLFYAPYYPFLTKRKSGLLPPKAGSDPYGNFFYRQSYFLAPSPHWDATFTADYRSGSMAGGEVEYRRFFSRSSYLEARAGYYRDRAKDKYWWVGRDYYRKNRFFIYGKGRSGSKWRYGVDYPSDKDLYYDVYFFEPDWHYKSFATSYLSYAEENEDLLWSVRGFYNYDLTSADRASDLLVLPDALFYLKQRPLAKDLYLDGVFTFSAFYKSNDAWTRARMEPTLRYSRLFGSTPVTFHLRPYYARYDGNATSYENLFGIEGGVTALLYDLDLIRTENLTFSSLWEGSYLFQPFVHRPTPSLDFFDLNARQNTAALKSFNSLLWKGREVFQLIAEQPYNFYGGYNFPTDGRWVSGYWLPLKLYYKLKTPSARLSLNGKFFYDHNFGTTVYHTERLSAELVKTETVLFKLNFGYAKSLNSDLKAQTDQYSYGADLSYDRWRFKFLNRYDRLIGKTVRTDASVGYSKECWALSLNYSREYNRDRNEYNWSLFLTFTLFGKGVNLFLGGGTQ